MGNGYTSESLNMLKTAEGQSNAVFACFGSAAQHCQLFEAALGEFLLVYNKASHQSLTLADLETIEAKLLKKTMGSLLIEFRKHVTIKDSSVETCLSRALDRRNFLMHHFFRERDDKLRTESGRMELLRELVEIEHLLDTARILTNAMRFALVGALDFRDGKSADSASEAIFTIDVDLPGV